jgi:hypothetical protein
MGRSLESLKLQVETLMLEILRTSRLERRMDRLDKDQDRDTRLEAVEKGVARLSEVSVKILESTSSLAGDLKNFSLDIGEHLKEAAQFRS